MVLATAVLVNRINTVCIVLSSKVVEDLNTKEDLFQDGLYTKPHSKQSQHYMLKKIMVTSTNP